MGDAVQLTFQFLIETLFGLFSIAVLIRVLLHSVQADYYNPIVNAVIRMTTAVVKWPKKIIPDVKNIETSALAVLLLVIFLKLFLVILINGQFPTIAGLILWTIGSALALFVKTMLYLIIINAVLSWIPNVQPTFQALLVQLTDPLLKPARKYIPLVGGLDLSPLVVLVALQVLLILIVGPLLSAGASAALLG